MTPILGGALTIVLLLLHVVVPGIYGSAVHNCAAPGQRFRNNATYSCPYMVMARETEQTTEHVEVEVTGQGSLDNVTSLTIYGTSTKSSDNVIGQFIDLPDYVTHFNCSEYEVGSIIVIMSRNASLQRVDLTWRSPNTDAKVAFMFVLTTDNRTCIKKAAITLAIKTMGSTKGQPIPTTREPKTGDHFSLLYSWLRNAGVGVAVIAVMIIFFYFLYKKHVKKQKRKRAELPLLGHPSPEPERIARITLSPSPLLGRHRPGMKPASSLMDMPRPADRLTVPELKVARSLNDITVKRSGSGKGSKSRGIATNVTRNDNGRPVVVKGGSNNEIIRPSTLITSQENENKLQDDDSPTPC